MQLSRQDIASAAESAEIRAGEYTVHENYGSEGIACPAVSVPADRLAAFVVRLGLVLGRQGRPDDAVTLVALTPAEPVGDGMVAYWPFVELTA